MSPGDIFNQLPDNIMVEIFQMFATKELLQMATVCKRWESLIRDKWIWTVVKFTPDPIEKSQFSKIIKRYFSIYTKYVDVCGKKNNYNGKKTKRDEPYALSDSVLMSIADKSPNLVSFCIEDECLKDINLKLLPSNLQHLSFTNCDIFLSSFDECVGKFKELKSIAFKRCPLLTENHLKKFTGADKLETIKLYGCHKIDDDAIQVIVKQFPSLRVLSLVGCARCSDNSCFEIARSLNKLEFLDIEEWTGMTDAGKNAILNSLSNLKFFSIKCRQLNYGQMQVFGSRLLVSH